MIRAIINIALGFWILIVTVALFPTIVENSANGDAPQYAPTGWLILGLILFIGSFSSMAQRIIWWYEDARFDKMVESSESENPE